MEENTRTRMFFDFDKHLTTLSLACILLMAGLVERVFLPVRPQQLEVMFVCFGISLFFSLFAMLDFIVDCNKQKPSKSHNVFRAIGFIGFIAGLICANNVINDQREARKLSICYEAQGILEADNTFVFPISNTSSEYDAVINKMEFIISDSIQIAKLEKIHLRPSPGDTPCAKYDREGYFYTGCWRGNDYVFISNREIKIPKGEKEQIRLRIANKFYGDMWLKGRLVFYFNSPLSPYEIPDVSIKASPKYDTSKWPC